MPRRVGFGFSESDSGEKMVRAFYCYCITIYHMRLCLERGEEKGRDKSTVF